MRQAVILAGGKGTRLKARLEGRPKPLVRIDGVPLLGRQLQLLRSAGFGKVIVLVDHAQDQIRAYCAENEFGLPVSIIDDNGAKGTAGAVLAAVGELSERFLIVYGDTLLDVDLAEMWAAHEQLPCDATLFLHPNDHPHDSDLIEVDDQQFVVAIHPYPHRPDALLPNLVNAALYIVERRALDPWAHLPPPLDFAKDLFPAMIKKGQRLRGYRSFEYVKDVGTPERLDRAVFDLRCGKVARARRSVSQKAVFFDRDGTLNRLRGYIRSAEDLEVLPGVPAAIRRLNDAEYRVAVITNQPVLARGEASVADLAGIHAKLDTELGRGGAFLDDLLYCPHHPDGGFPGEVASLKVSCACRKPGVELLSRARDRLNVDMSRSWFVGDSTGDALAAKRAGLRAILVQTGEGGRDARYPVIPEAVLADVSEAVKFILDIYPALHTRLAPVTASIGAGNVVLVGGLARLGKSTLASALACAVRERGGHATVIALDRFIRSSADRVTGIMGRFDLDSVESRLAHWLKRRHAVRIKLPWYDRLSRIRYDDVDLVDIAPDDILIIEGVPALALTLNTKRQVHSILVTGSETERRLRVEADLVARGASAAQAVEIYFSRSAEERSLVEHSTADFKLTIDDLVQLQ